MPVSSYALNIVTGAGLGLGIDYSLLLVSRYREELARRGPGAAAVRTTLATAGRTVAFSSITVGAAIATLAVFPLGFLRSMGIAGGLVGPLAGLIALTVLPGALRAARPARRRALALGRWRRAAAADRRRRRGRLVPARARPDAPADPGRRRGDRRARSSSALPFLSIRFTGVDASVLPPNISSRQVDQALRRDFHATLVSPAYAVVKGSAGDRADLRGSGSPPARRALVLRRRDGSARASGRCAPSSGKPFLAAASQRLVHGMRALPGGAPVGGSTAQYLDQRHTLGSLPAARDRSALRRHLRAALRRDPFARPAR